MFSVTLALESKFLSHSYAKWHLQSEGDDVINNDRSTSNP